MKTCSSCGMELPEGASFCGHCGGSAVEVADAAPVAVVAEETPVKKKVPKKWLLILIAVLAALGVVATVGFLTNWFGLVSPLHGLGKAFMKTAQAESATIQFSVKRTDDGDTYKEKATAKLVLDKDKKKVTYLTESDESTTLYVNGDEYYYREPDDEDDRGYASIYEGEGNDKDFFDNYNDIVKDGKIDWTELVKKAELGEYINESKIDDFIETVYEECLSDKEWLQDNLGFEKNGKTYVFEPDFEELGESIVDLCKDSKAFKKDAKQGIEDAMERMIEGAEDNDVRITVSITVKKGYISEINVVIKGEDDLKMEYTLSITNVNKTEITSKEISRVKNNVRDWIEENACDRCGEGIGDYEYDGEMLCYGCYYTCESCGGHNWSDYERDGMRVCYDCRYVCEECNDPCGNTYSLNGKDVCEDCYYTCDNCGEVSDWSLNTFNGKRWCDDCYSKCSSCGNSSASYTRDDKRLCYDCYYKCSSCGNSSAYYERDGKPVCYDCRYVCTKCGDVCGSTYRLNGQDVCHDCYYTCDKCGEVSEWSINSHNGQRWCDDCYYECAYCGSHDAYYEEDGKRICWDCYYDW